MTALEELDLYGTRLTDQGIASLRNLVAMRNLNLLGAEVTDASTDVLARMPHLQELNLYRSHVSNSGLAKLSGLNEQAALDIRYSRVTAAGNDAFAASHPDCNIESAGGVMVGSSKASSVVPAGKGDHGIAEWVHQLGGKSEFRGDTMVTLSLAATPVTDTQLSNLRGLTGLDRLDLDATQIGDLGLRSLVSLRALKVLNLNNTSVSDAGLESLSHLQ